jgi:hypothetical protein
MTAMGNTLLPLREGVYNTIWFGIVQGMFPGATIKNTAVLESLREVRNVVSDKTGTLTVDGMSYTWPVRFSTGESGSAASASASTAGVDADPCSQFVDPTEPDPLVAGSDSSGGDAKEASQLQYWRHGAGPLLLLATNDSVPNPQYSPSDGRDVQTKSLVRPPRFPSSC